MNNKELLEKLKSTYETILGEDVDITKEIEKLSKERDELYSSDKIKKLEKNEFILKNGKSFKGILKSYFSNPDGEPLYIVSNIIVNLFYFGLVAFSVYMIFGTTYTCPSIVRAIMYVLAVIEVALGVSMPVTDIIHINKVNKKYNLEEISLELENAKKRKEVVVEELELKKSLHEIKEQKLNELEGAIKSIEEIINTQSQTDNYDLTNEQAMKLNIETKEEGKKLKLERK